MKSIVGIWQFSLWIVNTRGNPVDIKLLPLPGNNLDEASCVISKIDGFAVKLVDLDLFSECDEVLEGLFQSVDMS